MRKFLLAATVLAAPLVALPAHAIVVLTYGQTGGSNTITATPNASDTQTTISGTDIAIDVTQCIATVGCLGAEFLDITATSTDAAQTVGTAVTQHYNGTFSIFSGPGMTGFDVLSGTFTDAVFGAGPQLTLAVGNPPDSLTLTSTVIPAAELVAPNAIGFTFTNVIPPVGVVGSGCAQFPNSMQPCTLAGMDAAVAGNASASVPEPASLGIFAVGLLALGFTRRYWYN